jgi:hypothetical protein
MERLYALSAKVYALRPWEVLEEGEFVLTRDSGTGEACYCAVMGALGQVIAVYAYIGVESYRLFRRMLAGEVSGAGEFYELQRSVSLEFVPARELDAQDRKLLTALRHPIRSAGASPVFRAGRPGFFPWYVTEQEARLLEECLRAVIVICSAVSANPKLNYWERHYTYPLVSRVDGKDGESRYSIELAEATLPQEPPLAPAHLGPEQVRHATETIRSVALWSWTTFPAARRSERKTNGKRASGLQWPSMLTADSSFRQYWRPLMFRLPMP